MFGVKSEIRTSKSLVLKREGHPFYKVKYQKARKSECRARFYLATLKTADVVPCGHRDWRPSLAHETTYA